MTFTHSSLQDGPELTGRMIVTFADSAELTSSVNRLNSMGGFRIASSMDMAGELPSDQSVVFENLGIAVLAADPERLQVLTVAGAEDASILATEPEVVCYAIDESDYLRGFEDGVNSLIKSLRNGSSTGTAVMDRPAMEGQTSTWGLDATKVPLSQYTGKGTRVAVLDTGLDLSHPDFQGRAIVHASFVPGEPVQDRQGHGTHCIGTALGPKSPSRTVKRYGIAYESEIFVGKVLSNAGSGNSGWILNGISWAASQGCSVISMSLGSPAWPGQPYFQYYEIAAQRALKLGSIIIAAARNESRRQLGQVNPVGHPANCPSVMAVAAVDSRLQVAPFSCAGINGNGGQVDIAGPGVDVYSTWPGGYNTVSGTSMATPHVAGIAALHAQSSGARGTALWQVLTSTAKRLPSSSTDVGNGLVQAP